MKSIMEYATPGHFTFKRKNVGGKETDWHMIWSFLNDNGPADKRTIFKKLFEDRYPSHGYNPIDNGCLRGWYSTLFRAATMMNVLKYDRNKKVWSAVPEKDWKNDKDSIDTIYHETKYRRDPRVALGLK